jgi:hypothetical protein
MDDEIFNKIISLKDYVKYIIKSKYLYEDEITYNDYETYIFKINSLLTDIVYLIKEKNNQE